MKKLFAVAIAAIACALSISVSAEPAVFNQSPVPAGPRDIEPTIGWVNVLATMEACKHSIAGVDRVMEKNLAMDGALDEGVKLTKKNYQRIVMQRKAVVLDAVEVTVESIANSGDCNARIDWANGFVKTAKSRTAKL